MNFIRDNQELTDEIKKIPYQERSIAIIQNVCSCVFGMPVWRSEFKALSYIPEETKGLYFYLGSDIKDLLRQIAKLDLANNIEYLTIGTTNFHKYNTPLDYAEISKVLSNSSFPNLRFFEYGIDEVSYNGHSLYGNLGNITCALENMPKLEKLYLFGNFELSKSLKFNNLSTFEILMNNWVTNINGGRISNNTIQNLLSSNFSELSLLSLNLDFNDEIFEYSLPEIFLTGRNIQKLKHLEIEGNFVQGSKVKISQSKFLNESIERINIEELKEPR